jgi:hypothetical protein
MAAYLNSLHRAADWLAGLIWTSAERFECASCKRPVSYFTERQRAQWERQKSDPAVEIECRGVLPPFRRECKGWLVPAEAAARS